MYAYYKLGKEKTPKKGYHDTTDVSDSSNLHAFEGISKP